MLLIAFATFLAYSGCLRGSFVWDDDFWTLNLIKAFPSLSGLGEMWTHPTGQEHQYYPLTATSFWLDYHLWGFWTLPYHVENVVLHLAAALIFWQLLKRLAVSGAGLAAAVFALHPLMVESVAWIAERKNVLSLVLFLGALLSYGRFARLWGGADSSGEGAPRDWKAYVAALVLFLAAYLAKATVFAFPAVLLLLAWWKRGRLRWRADVSPALPFFGISLALGLFTSWLERGELGAQGPEFENSLPARCLIAGRALWFYLGKVLWPAQLCFNYPHWKIEVRSMTQWLWPLGVLAVLVALWLLRRRLGRGPLTAALFFVGTAFPLLGFMNAYYLRYSYVADHWVYLPSLGLLALFGAVLSGPAVTRRLGRNAFLAGSGMLLLLLGGLTWGQASIYADDETLWRDTATKNPESWMAWNFLGFYAQQRGSSGQAMNCYRRSISIHPSFEACYNLGKALAVQGESAEEAIAQFRRSIELRPGISVVYENLGIVLAGQGRFEEAIAEYGRAIQYGPRRAYPHFCLGATLERLGRTKEAVAQYREAIRLNPRLPEPLRNLAAILASDPNPELRDGAQAVRFAEQACQLTHLQDPLSVSTLAMAFAEAGRFDEAVRTAQEAERLAAAAGDQESAEESRKLAERFRSGQAYHESPATGAPAQQKTP